MKTGALNGTLNANQYQVVYDSGELGSAVTSVIISGLDGDTDAEYFLLTRTINAYNGSNYFRLKINNDGGSNYGIQEINSSNTTATAYRNNSLSAIQLSADSALNQITFCKVIIQNKSGYVRLTLVESVFAVSGTTVSSIDYSGYSWNNTSDNITSLVITSDQANGIGVGSRFILLAKKAAMTGARVGDINAQGKVTNCWQKIYENTLGSDATSVTISGLDGNTEVLYRLVMRKVNNGAGGGNYIRLNNDSATNYGYQLILASDTSISASRGTAGAMYNSEADNSGQRTFDELILYAKSGYVRTAILEGIRNISTTGIGLRLYGHSWNNTSDNITSIVVSDVTDGLGTGTYICLYRLNL